MSRPRRPVTHLAVVVSVVSLPLLHPSGPGNTGVVDLGVCLAVFVTALWVSGRGHALRLPYAGAVGLTIAAGALAGIGAGGGGLALIQDLFVLVWAISLANLGRDPALLRTITRTWAISASCWALVLVGSVLAGVNSVAGITAQDGNRASFTLGDPNLAANYFLCSLLVLRACQVPARRRYRWACCALLVTAMVLTGSNGGALGLIVATSVGAFVHAVRRHGLPRPLLIAGVLAMVLGTAATAVDVDAVVAWAQQSSPVLRDSIGRRDESGGSRSTLATEALGLWVHSAGPIGVGAGGTKHALRALQSPYVKEAHNDYTAALVERGLLGGGALLLLVGVLAVRCRRIAGPGRLRPEYAALVPRPELLAAAALAMLVSGFFYEVYHFRHVWALFGVIAAVEMWGVRRAAVVTP